MIGPIHQKHQTSAGNEESREKQEKQRKPKLTYSVYTMGRAPESDVISDIDPLQALEDVWQPITFTVHEVAIITREVRACFLLYSHCRGVHM